MACDRERPPPCTAVARSFRLGAGRRAPVFILLAMALLLPLPATAQEVDPALFRETAIRRMAGKAKGWSFVIANANGIVAQAWDGWAWAPGDGGIQFSSATLSNTGSVSKVLTGVALLDILEARGGVADGLNKRLRDYVPARWIEAYFDRPGREALSDITLRHLLGHRSGLPQESSAGVHGTRIARALADGNDAIMVGNNMFEYNNNNYTLLLYVIPTIVFPEAVRDFERRHRDMSLADHNRQAAVEYGALYELWMRNFVLSRDRVPGMLATCRPRERAPFAYAKEYSSVSDGRGGTQDAEFCRSQGTWLLSTLSLARFAAAVEFTETYLEPATRALLQPDNSGGMLVYSRIWSEPRLPGRKTGHGGHSPLGGRAAVVRLPWGHIGAALSNSSDLNSESLGSILIDTFWEATR
jgi:hypothetical protein